ncbi:hypothetical protein HDA32_000016 [Spinactinospora alkalitolerans]|uniref:Uncharacterized protein n=1 Tax=Spinactinospora alkalitolerans TaxID=687207 RepID=A0A852TL10_9ACTN|nr:hypothetical protein [Spinactinospora alkalitolerans]
MGTGLLRTCDLALDGTEPMRECSTGAGGRGAAPEVVR